MTTGTDIGDVSTGLRQAPAEPKRVRPGFITEIDHSPSSDTVVRSEPSTPSLISHLAHRATTLPVPFWAAIDAVLAYYAVMAAHRLSPVYKPNLALYSPRDMAAAHAVLFFIAAYAVGLYGRAIFNSAFRLALLCSAAAGVAVAATTLYESWYRYAQVGRWVVAYTLVLTFLTTLFVRITTKGIAGRKKLRVLFVGDTAKYEYLAEEMRRNYCDLYDPPTFLETGGLSRETGVARSLELWRLLNIDEVIIQDDSDLIFDLLHASAPIVERGSVLRTLSAFHEELLHEVPVDSVDCRTLIGPGWGIGRQSTEIVKRAFDIGLAVIGLTLASPVALAVALAIKLTSRGPIIYRQTRVGRFGTHFSILKFRTMVQNAETNGAVWASLQDSRVTSVGRLLRKARLDELPQLLNVLRGQMSFVGPRPERPEFVAELEKEIPYYQLRHLVPPGLTGWAQIQYPYASSVEDAKRKLCYDLYYVRRYGFAMDLAICLRTVFAVARGAR